MTVDDQLGALKYLGLSETETRFLAMVGQHGGCCMVRQYTKFAGFSDTHGRFLKYLVRRGDMVRFPLPVGLGAVYQLTSKRLYRLVGRRPPHWWEPRLTALARKVMLLDVVIAHPTWNWVADPADLVALFADRFGVPVAELPQRLVGPPGRRPIRHPRKPAELRYFPDFGPIALVGTGDAERVLFVVLSIGSSGRAISRFVLQCSWLLARLPAWTVMAVTPSGDAELAACRARFHKLLHPGQRKGPGGMRRYGSHMFHAETDGDVIRYFQTRRALESGDPSGVSVADLDHYREARTRLMGAALEGRYETWRVRESIASRLESRTVPYSTAHVGAALDPSRADFLAYRLPYDYRGFGLLMGER